MSSKKNVSSQRGINTQNNPQTRDVNAATRVSLALQLRARKLTYEAIAQQCGYANASAARKAILRELDRTISRDVSLLRKEELDSLERLELECWKRLQDKEYVKPMLFAVDRILAIKERRAKLMGLDMKPDEMPANMVVIREIPQGLLSPAIEEPHV